jgi:hypothetical protein
MLLWSQAALSVLSVAAFESLGGIESFVRRANQLSGSSGDEHSAIWRTLKGALNSGGDNWMLASRIAGVPVRHPFCDLDLVELALAMPNNLAVRNGTNRFVHREALRDLIPEEIRWRTSKAEFSKYFQDFMIGTATRAPREAWRPIEDLVEYSRAIELLTPESPRGCLPMRFAFAALCVGSWLSRYEFSC